MELSNRQIQAVQTLCKEFDLPTKYFWKIANIVMGLRQISTGILDGDLGPIKKFKTSRRNFFEEV